MTILDNVDEAAERRRRLLALSGEAYRDQTLSKDVYLSREIVKLENDRLWPRTWLNACRSEEIPALGDFFEFQVGDDSIAIVRTSPTEIRAFHNVCQHRGRRLVHGRGNITQFRCGFHAWRWDLNGQCKQLVYEDEFVSLRKEDVPLKAVRLEQWGGYVWINMDPHAPPLREFLAPIPNEVDGLEPDKMRYRWYKTTVMPANWKIVMEAFLEQYHVPGTHPGLIPLYDERSVAFSLGLHSRYVAAPDSPGFASPSRFIRSNGAVDAPRALLKLIEFSEENARAQFTPLDLDAARALQQLPPETSQIELLQAFFDKIVELGKKRGIDIAATMQDVERGGGAWHVFPNHVFLPFVDGSLCYRFRPNGDDPNSSWFDAWSLVRYAPGEEPDFVHEVYDDPSDANLSTILEQDLSNLAAVQNGIKSRGFSELRVNPIQEGALTSFRRNYDRYMQDY